MKNEIQTNVIANTTMWKLPTILNFLNNLLYIKVKSYMKYYYLKEYMSSLNCNSPKKHFQRNTSKKKKNFTKNTSQK